MKQLLTLGLWLAILTSSQLHAATGQDELAELKASMLTILARIEALEAENRTLKANTAIPVASADMAGANAVAPRRSSESKASWADKIALKGDLRYRYEGFNVEGSKDRSRNRVRARLQINAEVADDVSATFRLATGAADPVSANQTLGDGASAKNVSFDMAYITWNITPELELLAGKYKNNLYKPNGSQLLWDDDYNPEGMALVWTNDKFFANAAYQWLESDSRTNNDLGIFSVQGGFDTDLGDSNLRAGIGYYGLGAKGYGTFFGDPDDFFGNSFNCANAATLSGCVYTQDYNLTHVFALWSGSAGDLPLTLFAEAVNNSGADDLNKAWSVGGTIGEASTWNTWEFIYQYQDLEQDAAFALHTGSNFGGGGTGSSGHIIEAAMGVKKGWTLSLTYFLNENNIIGGPDRGYDRVQLDSQFKF